MDETTEIAILGCGYVSNMYRLTLGMHPELSLVGVFDRERSRAEVMARLTRTRCYDSMAELVADPRPRIVLNLTNPSEHYATTRALLEAGKHVYTEKPLAMHLGQARELATLARDRGLHLVAAPCTVMNPIAQTLWKLLRDDAIGRVRLVHAAMEDGMVPRAPVGKWINEAGVAWPAVDEYQTGCTVEHAGYVLTWLCVMFGPVVRLTAHAEELMPDKISGLELHSATDFSVAVLRFDTGVVARMTNGLYAAHDHTLRIFGDDGVITVADPRSDTSPIKLQRYKTLRRRRFLSPVKRRIKPLGPREKITGYRGSQTRDFCRLLAQMAHAIQSGTAPYTDADFALHITEVTLACHFATHPSNMVAGFDGALAQMPYGPVSRFAPIAPLDWAT